MSKFGILALKNILNFFSLFCTLLIMLITLQWIEAINQANFFVLDIFRPFTDSILNFADSICSYSLTAFNNTIDLKYLIILILLIFFLILSKIFLNWLTDIDELRENINIKQKRMAEKAFNRSLVKNIVKNEKQVIKYMVLIKTKAKKNFGTDNPNVDMAWQNRLMNDFIYEKTNIKYEVFNGGFLYYFDNFDDINTTLQILFKVLKSTAPIEYAICVQAGLDLNQLKKLSEFEEYGKIIISADTLFKYKYNKLQIYETEIVGIFQKEEGTLEVHRFKPMV